ncbi:MAG: hypothetical protein JOY54_10280 [Acidobacteriaceae bacterium]|nr:hypothetical protein [Acidobacteriaceae bacterium]
MLFFRGEVVEARVCLEKHSIERRLRAVVRTQVKLGLRRLRILQIERQEKSVYGAKVGGQQCCRRPLAAARKKVTPAKMGRRPCLLLLQSVASQGVAAWNLRI